MERDSSLANLLLLDGESFVIGAGLWVKFDAQRVPVSAERPHGLDYSLTLHDSENERLLGSDLERTG